MGSSEPHRNSTYMRSTFSVWTPSILLIQFTMKRPHGDKDWLHFLDPGEIPRKNDKLELLYKNPLLCICLLISDHMINPRCPDKLMFLNFNLLFFHPVSINHSTPRQLLS